MNRKHTEFIENIRSMESMIKTDMRTTDIDDKYYDKLEWWTDALISVIREIDRESEKTEPTIIEKAILDFIDSHENNRATMADIINACTPGENSSIARFVTSTIAQLQRDNRISKMWFRGDTNYTYEVNKIDY